jgi:hypothetical protein
MEPPDYLGQAVGNMSRVMGRLVGVIQAFQGTLQPVAERIDMQTPTGKIEGGGTNPLLKILQGQ